MDKFQDAIQIKKSGEDSYEVKNRAANVDEKVDSSHAFGILNREQLIGATADEVMRSLEEHFIGYEITIKYLKRPCSLVPQVCVLLLDANLGVIASGVLQNS